jgi:PhoH-like ATPase
MSPTQNCYLLDTSVILDDPTNILRISDENKNGVVITNIVLAELNSKKDDMRSEAGFQAREFFRLADAAWGEPISFIELPECVRNHVDMDTCKNDRFYRLSLNYDRSLHGGEANLIDLFIVHRENYRVSHNFSEPKGINDAKIAEIADDYDLTLLSNDMSFRIAAEIRGIQTQSIRNSSVEAPEQIDFTYTYEYEDTPPSLSMLNITTLINSLSSKKHSAPLQKSMRRGYSATHFALTTKSSGVTLTAVLGNISAKS